MRIGLRRGRRVGGKRRSEVAEARHCDHAESTRREWSAKIQTLVITSTGAVHEQHRRSVPDHCIFNGTAACLRNAAPLRDTLARLPDIAVILRKNKCAQRRSEAKRDRVEDATCAPHVNAKSTVLREGTAP